MKILVTGGAGFIGSKLVKYNQSALSGKALKGQGLSSEL